MTQEKTKSKEKSSQNYKTHATEITITEDKTNRKLNQHPKTLLTKTNLKIDRSPPRDKAREKINKDFKSSEAGKRTEPMIEKKPIISRSPMNVKAVKKIETPQLLKKEIPTKKKIEASPQRKLNGVKLFNSSDKKSQKPKGELKSIEIDITSKRKKGKDNLLETNERIIPVCKFTSKYFHA